MLVETANDNVVGGGNSATYDWLNEIVALATTPADHPGAFITLDVGTPVRVEASDTDSISTADSNDAFINSLKAVAAEPIAGQQTASAQPAERRDSNGARREPDAAAHTRAATKEFARETPLIAAPSEVPLVEEQILNEALRASTQAMREEMNKSAQDERLPEHIADIGLRVSGTVLSTGSLAWLLRGGSLFASALSAVPTWRGFDPLPILTKAKRRKTKPDRILDKAQREEEKTEAAVARVLGDAKVPSERKQQVARNEEDA